MSEQAGARAWNVLAGKPPSALESSLAPAWQEAGAGRRIARVARVLARAYGTPDLGNLPDPLDEAAYILLTYQTTITRAQSVWRDMRAQFASWDAVMAAPEERVAAVLRPAGLHVARARLLRAMLHGVVELCGSPSLEPCRAMDTDSAESLLRRLPGLDRKSARCVLLYSLGRPVLPVDSNTHRFALRFGVLREGTPYRRARVHDELQDLVPVSLRHDFHVNLVAHGQRTCTPRVPRCGECPVKRTCMTGRAPG